MKCGEHTEAETNLRCGKCEKLICPKCMVQTPVGARCHDCAGLKRLPVFDMSAAFYMRGIAAGLIAAFVAGFAWSVVEGVIHFFYVGLLIAAGMGWGVGEVISRAVNRKQGTGLAVVAGVSMVVCFVVYLLFSGGLHFSFMSIGLGLVSLIIGIYTAVKHFK